MLKQIFGILLALSLTLVPWTAAAKGGAHKVEGIYRGIVNYGSVDRDQAAEFTYRFTVDGKEKIYSLWSGESDENGPSYPLQNQLKEGYRYELTVQDGVVTQVKELNWDKASYTPPVSGEPGVKTLKNLLATAMMPVGTTLYVYGGGWNWQDNDSAVSARTLGLSPDWMRFFQEQDGSYTYRDADGDSANADPAHSYYPYGRFNQYWYAGLDCSGYMGWTLYNTLQDADGSMGYVSKSSTMAKGLSERGYGTWTHEVSMPDGSKKKKLLPGDVISLSGHVWMALGTCDDGSVLMVHSSPTRSYANQPGGGVQIGAIGKDYNCEALVLAEKVMTDYFPAWHERYPVFLLSPERYFPTEGESTGRFSWDVKAEGGLSDPDGVQKMTPAQVLDLLFRTGETKE